MIGETLSTIEHIEIIPVIALVMFFLGFAAVVVWALRLRKPEVARMSRLPLDDGAESFKEGDQDNG